MCAPSADDLNRRIRDFFHRRCSCPLSSTERAAYRELLTAWAAAAAIEHPTVATEDIVEAA